MGDSLMTRLQGRRRKRRRRRSSSRIVHARASWSRACTPQTSWNPAEQWRTALWKPRKRAGRQMFHFNTRLGKNPSRCPQTRLAPFNAAPRHTILNSPHKSTRTTLSSHTSASFCHFSSSSQAPRTPRRPRRPLHAQTGPHHHPPRRLRREHSRQAPCQLSTPA